MARLPQRVTGRRADLLRLLTAYRTLDAEEERPPERSPLPLDPPPGRFRVPQVERDAGLQLYRAAALAEGHGGRAVNASTAMRLAKERSLTLSSWCGIMIAI